jgi:hypothetical protein
MIFSKEKILAQVDIKELTSFLFLSGLAILVPAILHVQWLTGPIVNAIFVVALFLLGVRSALAVALVPSLIALSSGTLPAPLAPAIPFIMVGNAIYILAINYVYNNSATEENGYWRGIFIGSGLKFVFLSLSAGFIVELFTSETVALKISQMMTWTQFATAALGGMIAWIILRWIRRG